jgi:hypothetical protein
MPLISKMEQLKKCQPLFWPQFNTKPRINYRSHHRESDKNGPHAGEDNTYFRYWGNRETLFAVVVNRRAGSTRFDNETKTTTGTGFRINQATASEGYMTKQSTSEAASRRQHKLALVQY